jgi:glycine cleavage system H protein
VKAAADVYAPVAGEVTAVNDKLADQPGLVNTEPTGDGWLFKMKLADAAEVAALLDEKAYDALTAAESH